MLQLKLSTDPRWLDLGHGGPPACGAAHHGYHVGRAQCPAITAAATDAETSASNDDLARIVAKAVARIVVKDWEGVGDEDGNAH